MDVNLISLYYFYSKIALAGEAFDLGLSVKWSSTNLGATSPSDYGDYFAWGETSPKDNYSQNTYEFYNGSSNTISKYNSSVDNKSAFKDYGYEDDAARQALGGKWRIPTDAEWTELRTECTWTWTIQNGMEGRLVTGKNVNSIFLPAAGSRVHIAGNNFGKRGYYWSSSLSMSYGPGFAWNVEFYPSGMGRGIKDRFDWLSIRPVMDY